MAKKEQMTAGQLWYVTAGHAYRKFAGIGILFFNFFNYFTHFLWKTNFILYKMGGQNSILRDPDVYIDFFIMQ